MEKHKYELNKISDINDYSKLLNATIPINEFNNKDNVYIKVSALENQ